MKKFLILGLSALFVLLSACGAKVTSAFPSETVSEDYSSDKINLSAALDYLTSDETSISYVSNLKTWAFDFIEGYPISALLLSLSWEPTEPLSYIGDSIVISRSGVVMTCPVEQDVAIIQIDDQIAFYRVTVSEPRSGLLEYYGEPIWEVLNLQLSFIEVSARNIRLEDKDYPDKSDLPLAFMEAYGTYLVRMTPHNCFGISEFRLNTVRTEMIENDYVLFFVEYAVKPITDSLTDNLWIAGDILPPDDNLNGFIIKSGTLIFRNSCEGSFLPSKCHKLP